MNGCNRCKQHERRLIDANLLESDPNWGARMDAAVMHLLDHHARRFDADTEGRKELCGATSERGFVCLLVRPCPVHKLKDEPAFAELSALRVAVRQAINMLRHPTDQFTSANVAGFLEENL